MFTLPSVHMIKPRKQGGFTLIELLLVVAIISLLAVAVFAALNPASRLKDTKNARRTSDVDTILSAIHTYIVDNKGALPTGLTAGMSEVQLGTGNAAACSPVINATTTCNVAASTACLDLTTPLTKYLKSIPKDPDLASSATNTNYSVIVDTNGIVTVKSCGAENSTAITASR